MFLTPHLGPLDSKNSVNEVSGLCSHPRDAKANIGKHGDRARPTRGPFLLRDTTARATASI